MLSGEKIINQNFSEKTAKIEQLKSAERLSAGGSLNVRRALNSFYVNPMAKPSRFFCEFQDEPIEVISRFYGSVKAESSLGQIYNHLHSASISLGFKYTALGCPDSLNKKLNFTIKPLKNALVNDLRNEISAVYHLSETDNPAVKSFLDRTGRVSANISFSGFDSDRYDSVIIPLSYQNESKGVFIAGTDLINKQHTEVLKVLCSYTSLLIANNHLKDKLYSSQNRDGLTGLITHREFQEKLAQAIKNAEQNDESVSVVIFDINNISKINREYGHSKGDEIISMIARKIRQNIREKDLAARYGGDEIAVILYGADNAKACYISKFLNSVLSEGCVNGIGSIKASVGVSTYPTCAKEQEKLLILAEQAMLISKHNGYKNGAYSVVSAQDVDFWNAVALDTLARVIAKRHAQWGVSFEEELVKRFLKTKKLPKIPIDVVTSLAGAIDAKDTYTRGHSQTVSRFSEALARASNFPEKTIERIKLAALLHDVGKIGISESILRKPGALTDHEWEVMKQHPVIGAKKVLEPVKSLKDLIPIVRHHHERIDGNGYPDRLKGDEIPLGAKIVGIADAFHALISHRPYRKSLSLEKALQILKEGAGTQWDADLVEKFVLIAPSLYSQP